MKKLVLAVALFVAGGLAMNTVVEASRSTSGDSVLIAQAETGSAPQPAPGEVKTIPPMDAGSATAPAPKPSDSLDNPAEHPLQAWDDLKAAKKTSWPLAVWAGLAMLGKALAYAADKLKTTPLLGKLAAWLAVGKKAMIVAAIGAIGVAGFDVLAQGGSWVSALVASGVALAGVTHSTTQGVAKA